jgi:hypothetical protein
VPGSLSAGRPVEGASPVSKGTWDEAHKDFIGVYRGKSKSRDEGYGKTSVKVGVATPGVKAMGQPPSIGQATFKRKRK